MLNVHHPKRRTTRPCAKPPRVRQVIHLLFKVSDIGSTITSANLAAQIRLQYKGDNAYYIAITPTAMNTLSQ